MSESRVGIDVDDLGLEFKAGIRQASSHEFGSVEFAAAGEVAAEALGLSGRRHLRRFISGLGLRIASLVADFPHLRLTDPSATDERVQRTCNTLALASDVGVGVVVASVGALTHPETGEPSPLAIDALRHIGEAADGRGVAYALRTSCDSADGVKRVLDRVACPALRIALDPAELVMAGVHPVRVIELLHDRVALFHARDASMGSTERLGRETLLGEGDVPLDSLLAMLDAAGYAGSFVLRRRDSANALSDLLLGRERLGPMLPSA